MLFKDIKQNYPVFILDKQALTLKQGKVTATTFPRMDATRQNYTSPNSSYMVVDVTIECDGKIATYTISDNVSITYAGNIVLATDKSLLINEVESMKNTAQQIINSVDRQREILSKSDELLSELNPAFRDRQENEKRFQSIEDSISRLGSLMTKQQEMMTTLLNRTDNYAK